jgi:radical SAM protein with 4Fe4S-binding SPASM domain
VGAAVEIAESELIGEPGMIKVVETVEELKTRFPQLYFGYNLSCGPDFYRKTIKEVKKKIGKVKDEEWVKTGYLCPAIGMGYCGISMRTGKIYSCFFAMGERDFLLGSIDLKKCEVTSLKKRFLDPGVLSSKLEGNCRIGSCVYHSICLGGCRSTAYIFAKRKGLKNPLYAGMDVCITKCKEKLGL